MDEITSSQTVIVVGFAALLGYVTFAAVRYLLPKRLRGTHNEQRDLVVQRAHQRRDQIIQEARRRSEEKISALNEELELSIEEERLTIEATEADLTMQEQFLEHEEDRVRKLESSLAVSKKKADELTVQRDKIVEELREVRLTMQTHLAQLADLEVAQVRQTISDSIVSERQLDSQKRIKDLVDDLDSHSKRGAERVLSRLLSRYQPSFVWPKSVNHVELPNSRLFDQLQANDQIIKDISQLTEGVEISLNPQTAEGAPAVIRLGGGYGIYKEAARLTLEELLPKGPNNWTRSDKVYAKHKKNLEIAALKLGKQAVRELGLTNIHEEIQKMIGALNWRTSYRQNQYFHSIEVARLAAILAGELGVDPEAAKRCGLLHDIGKGIDYRIEGSHAVISGDYADRFGEKRLICDTVMSHHNDLVLETPLSYVLKSADTLSGARPGARINLEEGYQDRLAAMEEAIKTFPGIQRVAIMNGGREVHISVNHKRIREEELRDYCASIARKIESDVAFPGQIKVLVTRRFEATSVA